ncbi:unnamed protein product [Auanema sp. JU1783]|nr:unnamed protein product [Auanema sp. JU1783]
MLKRIKAQVSQVANELPGVLSPGNDRNSSRDESFLPEPNEEGEIEGFLCPVCMTHFDSPDQLSQHFERQHSLNSPPSIDNPNFDKANNVPTSPGVFQSKDHEIEELKIQLKEEKTFSKRLKEELDRIQGVVAQATDVPTEEVPYLLQQIQVLEAGKSMVTQQMLEFEKDASQSKRTFENMSRERNDIMTKLKQQSQQIRELMDQNESFKNERDVLSEQSKRDTLSINNLHSEIDKLIKTLDQRPSEDDVAVLRTELVNAQKLMDEIAQQKDVEIEEHRNSIRHLNMERERDNCLLVNIQNELSEKAQNSTESNSIIEGLNNQLDDNRKLYEKTKKELTSAQQSVDERENRISELQSRYDTNVVELTRCQEKIKQLEDVVNKGTKEIDDSHGLNEKNKLKLLKLEESLQQMIEDKKKYEADVNGFEEKQQKQMDVIKSLELSNMDLTNEVASLGSMLEQERSLIEEKNSLIQTKDKALHTVEGEVEEFKRKVEKLEVEKTELTTQTEGLTKQINSLESNSKELAAKITEGEGGSKMIIDQLNAEKQSLSEEISFLASSIKEIKEEHSKKVEDTEKKYREKERSLNEKIQKIESEAEGLRRNLKESENDLSRKSERFIEMEKELDEERQKTAERVNKLKELVLQKDAGAQQLKAQLEEMQNSVEDKNRMIREKESQLDESKKRIEESVKHLEEAEAKARALENELKNTELFRETATRSESELKQRLDEANNIIDKLKTEASQLLFQLADDIKSKEDELALIAKEMNDKEDHWNVKKEEFLKQMDKNQEANDDLLGTITELKKTIEENENEKKIKESRISNLESTVSDYTNRVAELETMVEEKTSKIEEYKKSVTAMEEEKSELQLSNTSSADSYERLHSDYEALQTANIAHQEEIVETKEKLSQLQHELEVRMADSEDEKKKLLEQVEEKDEDLFRISQNMQRLELKLSEKEKESTNFNERISSFESELAGQKDILDEMEHVRTQLSENVQLKEEELNAILSEMKEKEDQFKIREADLNQIIIVLQDEGNGLSTKIEELNKAISEKNQEIDGFKSSIASHNEITAAKDKEHEYLKNSNLKIQAEADEKAGVVRKLESKCAQIEKLAKEIQVSKDKEISDKATLINRLENELEEKTKVMYDREESIKGSEANHKRSVEALESEIRSAQHDLSQWQKTAEELTMANSELQKQNSNWEEEKNALIERCLKTESDLEFERERSIENKRRFDDCLAAMHELGRANQSLQMDISKHTTRKWLDDSAALSCTDCAKQFSLTIRKHHCRICGLIFCSQCSDKTVRTASSKNPVRCCSNCHTEALNR